VIEAIVVPDLEGGMRPYGFAGLFSIGSSLFLLHSSHEPSYRRAL
jgi:hypothetical protein